MNMEKVYYCEECEAETRKYVLLCDGCNDRRLYNKAEKLTPDQYDGWIQRDGYGYNEGYFKSVDALVEWCEDEDIDLPDWVFCCEGTKHELDIDNAIENMLEDAFEDARDHLVDEKELFDFVKRWNAKQNIISYYPDYKRVVVLKGEAV